MANVLSTDAARVLVDTNLNDADLETVIGYEEAWLARRVGQLTGERAQRLVPRAYSDSSRLYLLRPTDSVEVSDAGTDLDPAAFTLVENGRAIEVVSGAWVAAGLWPLGVVEATYTPNDEDEVKRVVIELLRLTLVETGFRAETIGAYSYTRDSSGPQREALVRGLLPRRRAGTVPIASSARAASGTPLDAWDVGREWT